MSTTSGLMRQPLAEILRVDPLLNVVAQILPAIIGILDLIASSIAAMASLSHPRS